MSFLGQLGNNFSAGGGFSPLSLPDLWAWLPGGDSNFNVVSGNITEWYDQAGNGNNFTGSGGSEPELSTGMSPSLPINGIDVGYYAGDATLVSGYVLPATFALFSIFIVVYPYNGESYSRIIEQSYSDSFYIGGDSTGTELKLIVGNGSSPFGTCSGGTLSNLTPTLVSATWDGTTGTLYQNGIIVATDSSDFISPNGTAKQIGIGRPGPQVGGPGQWDGGIGEVIICTVNLTGSNLSNAHNYLLTKYGL